MVWRARINKRMSVKCIRTSPIKAAKFAHQSGGSDWECLAQRRKISSMCVIFKASTCQRAWKAVRDRLEAPSYLSWVDQYSKIGARNKEDTSESTPL